EPPSKKPLSESPASRTPCAQVPCLVQAGGGRLETPPPVERRGERRGSDAEERDCLKVQMPPLSAVASSSRGRSRSRGASAREGSSATVESPVRPLRLQLSPARDLPLDSSQIFVACGESPWTSWGPMLALLPAPLQQLLALPPPGGDAKLE
ncbi:unnamed protein product, partial [Polarella glacialis]